MINRKNWCSGEGGISLPRRALLWQVSQTLFFCTCVFLLLTIRIAISLKASSLLQRIQLCGLAPASHLVSQAARLLCFSFEPLSYGSVPRRTTLCFPLWIRLSSSLLLSNRPKRKFVFLTTTNRLLPSLFLLSHFSPLFLCAFVARTSPEYPGAAKAWHWPAKWSTVHQTDVWGCRHFPSVAHRVDVLVHWTCRAREGKYELFVI